MVTAEELDHAERFKRVWDARRSGDLVTLRFALVDPDHRGLAARYLGELGDAESIPAIRRLLDAADEDVRIDAARSLGLLKSAADVPRLFELARHDPSPLVRDWAVGAIGRIGQRETVEPLIELLSDELWRVRAGAALARIGDQRALEPVREAARREEKWRYRYLYRKPMKALERGQPFE
jgi:HEAT repeat protein